MEKKFKGICEEKKEARGGCRKQIECKSFLIDRKRGRNLKKKENRGKEEE